MPALDVIHPLYAHMEWADALVWRRILETPAAANDEKIRALIYHIHMVQRAFVTIWRNGPRQFEELSAFPDLPALMRWGRDAHEQLKSYLAAADASTLAGPLNMPWADRLVEALGRPAAPTTLGETMLQVPMHTLYHRGQVNLRLRELGGEPPLVDYIAWIWFGKPTPEWPPLTIL